MAEPYQMWVAGKLTPGNGPLLQVEDPATEELFASCHTASDADVASAISSAQACFDSGVWSRASRHVRADVLDRAAALLSAALPTLIPLEVRQTGRPIREMQAQVPSLTRWLRYYAAVLRTEERALLPTLGALHNFVTRSPLGVVAQITPFNHPLLIAVKKLAPALAAGNSVVVKPSELTPLTTLLLGPILAEAGLPAGAFTVLPGDGATTGAALVADPRVRKVDVTGGTAAGRAIGKVVGGNLARYTAELGGKAPVVVFADADLDVAVNGIAFGAFVASGQTCVAATRLLVERTALKAVVEKLQKKIDSITFRIGNPTNPASMMGPLISKRQRDKVTELVGEALDCKDIYGFGAGLYLDRSGPSQIDRTDFSKGYWMGPMAVYCRPLLDLVPYGYRDPILSTRLWREEAFGPVVVITGFSTEDEALELANDTPFGLGAGVWTRDLSRAFRVSERITAGIVWVNTHHRNDPSSPWGGATSDSGVGSENGLDAYHAYTTVKSTIINYASAEEALAQEDWFADGAENVRYG